MEYQLKNDSIEAWRIGSEPVPDWVAELVEDKTIRGRTDSSTLSVGTDDGPRNAQTGDYLTYSPTVWGEATGDAPQGEILAYRSVKLIPRDEFQKLYDVPADELPTATPVTESGLVASGEAARPLSEPEKDQALDVQQLDVQPAAAEEQPLELDAAFEAERPSKRRR